MRAENVEPRFSVLGGDSRSHMREMLYSSLNRSTTPMLIHINASSFSTVFEGDPRTVLQASRTLTKIS